METIKKQAFAVPWVDLLLVTFVSLVVHFLWIDYPASIVFDEVTFGKFLNSYAKGEYYFDLHPPLGKLLLYLAAHFGGINPNFVYDKIGTPFTDQAYLWIRSLTALAGTMIAPMVVLLMRGLGFSRWVALVAGVLVIFENALVVISRTFVFDVFLLSFGFASLAIGACYHRTGKSWLRWLSWMLGAATFSIKWTGLSFLAVLSLWEWQKGRQLNRPLSAWGRLFAGWSVALAFYFSIFVIHFAMVPRTGMGNDFMTPAFQSGLIGNPFNGRPGLEPPGIIGQFIELNQMMWFYQKTMHQDHPYSSVWYTWPVMYRPIYFWGNTANDLKERIYLLGNPLLWWTAVFAVLYQFYRYGRRWKVWLQQDLDGEDSRQLFLLLLFTANYLPFVFIGRVMFIYHYMVALIAAIMVIAALLERLPRRWWAWTYLGAAFLCFCFFAPLTYGLPLTDTEYNWRLWFSSWL